MVTEFIEQENDEQNPSNLPMRGYPPSALSMMYPQNNSKEIIQEYCNDNSAPKNIQKRFWSNQSKHLVLSFLDTEDRNELKDNHDATRYLDLMRDCEDDYDFDRMEDYKQTDLVFNAITFRAKVKPNGGINERMAQNTQINQSISTQTLKQGTLGGTGIMNGLKNGMQNLFG